MDVIIKIPLNTLGFNRETELDHKWLDLRIDIMAKYVFPSLIAQTDSNFHLFIATRKETQNYVSEKCLPYAVTLNSTIISTPEGIGADVRSVITGSKFLEVRLNSDDCYHTDFIKRLKAVQVKNTTEAIIAPNGYMWYQDVDVIVKREFPSPPFYGFIYDTQKFIDGFKYRPKRGHSGVKDMEHVLMPDRNWLWVVWGGNHKIVRGAEYPDYRKFQKVSKSVLKEFGL